MEVTVSRDDITYGIRRGVCSCPVAKALSRAFMTPAKVCGDGATVGRQSISLPKEAWDFINRFDQGSSVEPFEFEVH